MTEAIFQVRLGRTMRVLTLGSLLAACGGGGGGNDSPGPNPDPDPTLSFQIAPSSVTVPVGGRVDFTGPSGGSAAWSVDGTVSGNTKVGTITSLGRYLAPLRLPTSDTPPLLPSPSTAIGPTSVAVTAPGAANPATVTVVSRFELEQSVSVAACTSPPCPPTYTPIAVAAVDLTGDGRADLVTANLDGADATVLIRDGNTATFSATRYQVGSGLARPDALIVRDVTNDMVPDLVMADAATFPAPRAIRTLVGTGGGSFGGEMASPLSEATTAPPSLAVGQFNESDLLPDLVVANLTGYHVDILQGGGDGMFPSEITSFGPPSPDSISQPMGVVVADFDQNQRDDIAVANWGTSEVLVFRQTADATFERLAFSFAGRPTALAVSDLNGDGYPDLAVASEDHTWSALVSTRDARLFTATASMPTGETPVAIATADLNGDSRPDVIVVNQWPSQPKGTVSIYLGLGDGTAIASETYIVGGLPQDVAVGDMNGDGWLDLAVANTEDDTVSVLINRGDASMP